MNFALFGNKLGAAVVISCSAVFGAALPFFVRKKSYFPKVAGLLNAASAGAFMGLGLLHLLGESMELLAAAELGIHIKGGFYNLAPFFVFLGFVIVMFVEHVLYIPGLDLHKGCTTCSPAGASTNGEVLNPPKVGKVDKDISHSTSLIEGGKDSPAHLLITSELQLSRNSHSSGSEGDCCIHTRGLEASQTALSGQTTAALENSTSNADVVLQPRRQQESKSFSAAAFVVMLGLSIHSILAGMVVGLAGDTAEVWIIALSIVGHKWAEGFALSCELWHQGLTTKACFVYLAVLVCATPLGIFIGIPVASSSDSVVGVFSAIAAGTIIYVSTDMLYDVFPDNSAVVVGDRKRRMWDAASKFLLFICGVFVLFGLSLIEVSLHPHEHAH